MIPGKQTDSTILIAVQTSSDTLIRTNQLSESKKIPLITAKDIYEVPRLAVQGILAWTLPEPLWWPLSRLFGKMNAACNPTRTRSDASLIKAALANSEHRDRAKHIAVELWANRYEERFHYLRSWRPGGWNPSINISGAKYVESARSQGRGIVFWSATFAFNSLINKMAWYRLGLKVKHFSRPAHGFSTTRFGIRYLNVVRRGIEDRYLLERLMTPEHKTKETLNSIRNHLKEKGIVSFMIGDKGRQQASVSFLASRITLATGPLAIAHQTNAAVIPVSTLRTGPGRFEVVISAPINSSVGLESNVDFSEAVQTFADLITPYVLQDPGQWRGWNFVASPFH